MAVEDWKLQVSFKLGNDMINVRANTGNELSAALEEISEVAYQVVATRRALEGADAIAPLSTGGSTESTTPPPYSPVVSSPQQYGTVAPPALGPTCAHGARIHRVGISKKTNKPYDFWACPTPQGTPGQCAPANG